jgi:hypothetical protein
VLAECDVCGRGEKGGNKDVGKVNLEGLVSIDKGEEKKSADHAHKKPKQG